METDGSEKKMEVTQVSVGGFDNHVTAKMLLDYFEKEIGMVWRCRLKNSSNFPDVHPILMETSKTQIMNKIPKENPHAFVHFVHPDSAKLAMDKAGKGELVLNNNKLHVCLGPENPRSLHERRRTIEPYTIPDVGVEMGILASQSEFFVGWRGPPTGVDFLVDSFDGKCKLLFTKDAHFSNKEKGNRVLLKCNFKVEFLVREMNWIKTYVDGSSMIILFQLASSPSLYFRTADDDIEEPDSFNMLDDDDPWTRTIDFTPSGAMGRCNTYRFSVQIRYGIRVQKAMEYLRARRVQEGFYRQKFRVVEEPEYGSPMPDYFFSIHYIEGISFKVRYMINAALHKCVINQHQLSDQFYDLLRTHPEEVNIAALKHIWSYKRPVFDASQRLKLVQEWLLKNPKLLKSPKQLNDVMEVRRLVITPTKAYCLPPTVELSNRVLRRYRDISERFIRVTFMDEGMQTLNAGVLNFYTAPILKLISSNSYQLQRTALFRRIKTILEKGFHLCGREYSFLGFSSNQLRDRSAWFFAEVNDITVNQIKEWMGKFTNKNVAKCAARMGQCFSSTYATVEVPFIEVNMLPDIKRNGYIFSDGIGKITSDLALEVAEKLQLKENPSAYQIRYAGCKGVVACWPGENKGARLFLRSSMIKFESNHTTLEICSWTRFQPGFLNRQIVTLLSTLNVSDQVFWNMQMCMISKLDEMIVDTDAAFDVLTASCAEQGNTAAIMLSAGFKPQTEPHLRGMLSCVRAAQLWGLREKARIFVPRGRWLMGCLDELAVLEQGQCFIQVSTPSLENCFANHGSRFSETKKNLQVVKGFVVIAKNPCLHPGDVRVLEAVEAPGLSHLVDCLLFPQKGDRPHANEASGSDLDGDLYFVTWEEKLIPPSKTSWMPMAYTPAEETKLPRSVKQKDIIEFFTKSIVNENLGAICNAHVVHADLSEYGALDEKCIDLAERAAMAVDFPKTGVTKPLPSDLKPKVYPDFMGKEKWQSYKSNKILGRLYRKISDIYEKDVNVSSSDLAINPSSISYDVDLEILGSQDFVDEAWRSKCLYDEQLVGLLGQYKVNREEEVVTGQIWSMPKHNSRKRGDLEEKLKHAYKALRKEFRQVFENMGPGFDKISEKEKNEKYEQKASAWYQMSYHPDWVQKSLDLQKSGDGASGGETLMFSFSWIAVDYLARIKIRMRGSTNLDFTKPINSLVRYIADRM